MHGGIGLTFEHDIHFFLRRVALDRTLYGTPAQHRQRIASIVSARRSGMSDRIERADALEDVGRTSPHSGRARAWIREPTWHRLRPGLGGGAPEQHHRRGGAGPGRPRTGTAAHAVRRRLRRHLLPEGLRRPGPEPGPPAGVQRGADRARVPGPAPVPHHLAVRSGHPRLRHRGAEADAPAGHPPRRRAVDAVPVRAGRGFRRRRRPDLGRARRRRVDAQRLEGVDDGRLVVGLGPLPRPDQLGRARSTAGSRSSCSRSTSPASRSTASRC